MSFIDAVTENTPWTDQQIVKRTESMVRQVCSADEEMILNRKLQGVAMGSYTLSAAEQEQLQAFQSAVTAAQSEGVASRTENERLKLVLAHELAVSEVARLTLLIDGREEVPAVEEVLEELDPVTGEVLVEYVAPVPAIPAIEPLPETIEVTDEFGIAVTVPNPERAMAFSDLAESQAIVDGASADTLNVFAARETHREV